MLFLLLPLYLVLKLMRGSAGEEGFLYMMTKFYNVSYYLTRCGSLSLRALDEAIRY